MNDRERLEELDAIIDEISEFDGIVLVEGNKDRRSLDNLGLCHVRTIEVQREGGPLRAAEIVSSEGKDAMILTDWDDRGDRIASQLAEQLDALCIRYDQRTRLRLRDICIKDIKDVESLDSLYERLSNLINNQNIPSKV